VPQGHPTFTAKPAGHVATLVTRGSTLEALGRREEAIDDFREALWLYPEGQNAKDALKRLNALP